MVTVKVAHMNNLRYSLKASKPQRHLFRKLLRKNGFYKLQASVFISPYSLNREALEYLRAERFNNKNI